MLKHAYRLNPVFTLVPWRDLSEYQRSRLSAVLPSDGIAAILHGPAEAAFPIKALSEDLARLITQLAPGRMLDEVLPPEATGSLPELTEIALELVLDGVLEIQVNGHFASGLPALRFLFPADAPLADGIPPAGQTTTQRLSEEALQYALSSPRTEPLDIAILLYAFNRIPLTRTWKRRIPDERAVLRLLDLRDDGSWEDMPCSAIPRAVPAGASAEAEAFHRYWLLWRLSSTRSRHRRTAIKVYFSPLPDALTDVFRLVRQAAMDAGADSMKAPRALPGILRPDKLMVYFWDIKPALSFARDMASVLARFPGQGTPFTHQASAGSELVSLGVDPPQTSRQGASWRLYLTTKLSLAIQGARRNQAPQPLEYVRSYMSVLGVDSRAWRPLRDDWTIEFTAKDTTYGSAA
jgi:hypothetical protein